MRLPARVGDNNGLDGNAAGVCGVSVAVVIALVIGILPLWPGLAKASANVARAVETFCAPQPTYPSLSSCSTCHSSANHRGPNDLSATGKWAISSATYSLFCPQIDSTAAETTALSLLVTSSSASTDNDHSGSQGIGMGRGAVLGDQAVAAPTRSEPRQNEGFSLSGSLRRLFRLSDKP